MMLNGNTRVQLERGWDRWRECNLKWKMNKVNVFQRGNGEKPETKAN